MIETKTILLCAGIGLFLMMIPIIYRIIKGPTAIDRIVAVNVIGKLYFDLISNMSKSFKGC